MYRCPYELIKLGSLPALFPGLVSDNTQKSELSLIRHCSTKLKYRKYFSEGEQVIAFNNFRGTSYEDVVSNVLGNNTCLVLSDNCTKHVSSDIMSHDKSCAAAQSTIVLPAAAKAAPGSVDSISTVDSDNVSDTSELGNVKTNSFNQNNYDIVDDNVNNNNVVNRRGPIQRSPPALTCHCLELCYGN